MAAIAPEALMAATHAKATGQFGICCLAVSGLAPAPADAITAPALSHDKIRELGS